MVNLWAGKTPTLQCRLHHLLAAAAAFYFSKFRQDIGPSGLNSCGGPDDDAVFKYRGSPTSTVSTSTNLVL